jgi:hypothetical protein
MSTTRVSYIYKPDVPKSIQSQIQQLHEQETRIVELEVELSQLRKAHAELEHDLAPYRIKTHFTDIMSVQRIPLELRQVEAAPIHRCPDEILCLFFETFLSLPQDEYFGSPDHTQIRSLLLVCRRWYTLVTNTAKLWARIEASGLDLFDIGSRKSQFPYIFACLNRSTTLPITVALDMRDLSNDDYIAESLAQHAKIIVDEDEHDGILHQIRFQDWYYRSAWFESQFEPVFERLIGVDGEHIKRWGTIALHLPDDEYIAIRAWNILAKGLKAIENVFLENFPHASPDIFMPDFGTVKKFSLDSAADEGGTPITRFGLSPSTLKHLETQIRNPSIDLAELSHFRQLRTLCLLCIYLDNEGNLNESLDFSISLPHLETLSLSGNYRVLARLRFDFPSLNLLTVIWKVDAPLPAIHPRHIRVSRLLIDEPRKVIRDCILLSNALESITIDHIWEKDDVEEVVAQSKLEGMASSLTQIIVEHMNGEVERINV